MLAGYILGVVVTGVAAYLIVGAVVYMPNNRRQPWVMLGAVLLVVAVGIAIGRS